MEDKEAVTGQERGLVFRVIEGQKEYKIYSDGRTEGFAEGAITVNHLDSFLATAVQEHDRYRLQQDARRPNLVKGAPASRTA